MKQIEEIIRNTTEEEQEKVDWTKAWSTKYPVLEFTFPIDLFNKNNEKFHPYRKVVLEFNSSTNFVYSLKAEQ